MSQVSLPFMNHFTKIPLAQTIVDACLFYGVRKVVISPGSRNAPLTIGFTNEAEIEHYSIVDERCAAFFAMGMAQQTKEPVAIVCTSGSAMLNYYPAVTEAFYSQIPLVVISADRPPHLIDRGDGQTIRQPNALDNHVGYSASLLLDNRNGDNTAHQSYNEHQLKKAFATLFQRNIPIHINAPFDEPLYEQSDEKQFQPLFEPLDVRNDQLSDTSDFLSQWNQARRKMILVGCLDPDQLSRKWMDILANDDSVIVLTEATSNIRHQAFFEQIDALIAPIEKLDNADAFWQKLQPELLLTFGGMIVSKKIKAFLRKYPPQRHFHVDPYHANDTFFCLTKHFKTRINDFFESQEDKMKRVSSDHQKFWQHYRSAVESELPNYLQRIDHSDLSVFDKVIKSIPDDHLIHFANSSSIRYANLFSFKDGHEVFSNRGTSGIDGSTSTAIGAALMSKKPGLLITGDLSFFYDSNALWNDHIPKDFKIIMINNSGGGIFRILPGEKEKAYYQRYFETTHELTAEHLCKMYGFEYQLAENGQELDQGLSDLFTRNDQPQLLEVKTPRTLNDEVLLGYFSFLAERCF